MGRLRRGKADHPPKGSKDVLDAVVGVSYALLKDPVSRIESGHTGQLMPHLSSRVTPCDGYFGDLYPYMKDNDPILNELRTGIK